MYDRLPLSRFQTTLGLASLLCLLLLMPSISVAASSATAVLAQDGQAKMNMIVAPDSPDTVRAAAAELRDMLNRITGGQFELVESSRTDGIVVGLAPATTDWVAAIEDPIRRREAYQLRSRRNGLDILAASESGITPAVWELLHRIGFRQFFPGQTWEVVPQSPNLSIAVNVVESPDYTHRRIWYTYGMWPENRDDYSRWLTRNRMPGGFSLNTGHAYGNIIRTHKAEFDANPEFYALNKGVRRINPQAKFCISNPDLRKLVVAYAVNALERNPTMDSVSIDPSDGGNWCECEACAAIGAPSDLALTLANDISAVLEADWPGKYVAMYAYNEHSPPPSIQARGRVIMTVATAFLRGGFTVDQIIDGWLAKGVRQFGIREYYSIIHWDHDLPGSARGSRIDYLTSTIPAFHARGARFMSAESSDNFGPNGLGYYLASRMLWNVREADRVDELIEDFLTRAFGAARDPMREFYLILNGPTRPLLSEHMVGRMYRLLRNAYAAADATESPEASGVRARLDDLTLYTRYVELYLRYRDASGDARKAAHEAMIRHSYRIRRTSMVHSLAQYRTGFRDAAAPVPAEARWNVPEATNPWKSSDPWTDAELRTIVANGIDANPLRAFEPADFSAELIPATPLKLSTPRKLDPGSNGRGTRYFYTWIDQPPADMTFDVTGGLIAHYRDRGPARLNLEVFNGDTGEYESIANGESAPDGETRQITLSTTRHGLHRVKVQDGMDSTRIGWPADKPRAIETSLTSAPHVHGRYSYYFYVPRGTTVVGGYVTASAGSTLHDADGKQVATLGDNNGYFHVPVERGQDGRLWSVQKMAGTFKLMTVPPYVAGSAEELLLPREVVERDARP